MTRTLWHDQAGNAWQITLDIDVMRRVRAATGYDLARLFTPEGMEGLAADPVLLCDVVWQCVKPMADAKNVSHADFIKGMRGQAIENAASALVQAAIDFLPPSRAALLTRLRDQAETMANLAIDQATHQVAEMERNSQQPVNSGNP